MTIDHTEFRELSTEAASHFLGIFETAMNEIRYFTSMLITNAACVGQARHFVPYKKDETDEWAPHGHILMLLTWLKTKEHISGFLRNINSSVKRIAESAVIFTLDGHRSHIRLTDATATGW